MSSTTTRLSLYKPAGNENVNVTTDLNNNLDALDAAVGFPISAALPSSPFSGKSVATSAAGIYNTYFSNGTVPSSASWVEILNGSGTFEANIKLGSTRQLVIGSDVNLFRDSANVLRTNDSLIVDGALTVTGVGSVRTGRVTSDVTKISSTTLGNITGLAVAVEANAVYAIEAFVEYNSGVTPDIKFGWTYPASATIKWAGWGVPTSGSSRVGSIDTGVTTEAVALPFTGDAGGNPSVRIVGTITTAGTAGTLQATFAQNTSDATNTVVKAGAWLKLTRLA